MLSFHLYYLFKQITKIDGKEWNSFATKFWLQNSRVRKKERKGQVFLCVTRKERWWGEVCFLLSEGLHTWSINSCKVKKGSCFIILSLSFFFFFCRRMKQNQKTAYLMYQAMKAHENSWHMPRQKGFGCLWEKKSKLCSVRLKIFQVSLDRHISIHLPWGRAACLVDRWWSPGRLALYWSKSNWYLEGCNSLVFYGHYIYQHTRCISLFLPIDWKYFAEMWFWLFMIFLICLKCNSLLLFFKGWRCKRYGHRTGDKECPFFIKGNQKLEQFRVVSTNILLIITYNTLYTYYCLYF